LLKCLLTDSSLEDKKNLIEGAQDKHLVPVGDQLYSFYKAFPLKPLEHRKAHKMVSSLIELREEVRTWRRLGIGSALAFFGLTLSLLAFGSNIYRQNSDLSRQMIEGKNELEATKQEIVALRANLDRLASSVKQAPLPAAQPKPPKGPKKAP